MNRKEFLILTASCLAGCKATENGGATTPHRGERIVDAGPIGNFANDGVYRDFSDQGFFVIRLGGKLTVLSSICTHRDCKLTAEADRTFYCDCHGSTFDPDGKVTEGPAKRDLPRFTAFTDPRGHLLVKVTVTG